MEISLISNLNRFRSWLWFILSFLFLNKDPKACCMYVTYQKKKSLFYVCMLLTGTSLPNASMIVAKEHYPKNQLSKKKKKERKRCNLLICFWSYYLNSGAFGKVEWFLYFKVESQLSLHSLYCDKSFNGHQTFQEAESCEWQYQEYRLLHWPAEALDSNHKGELIYGVSGCQNFHKRLDSHTCGFIHVRNKQIVVT